MKALSLHQPWATAIAIGVKSIETRSWTTPYRGLLAIHATSRYTMAQAAQTQRYVRLLTDLGWADHARVLSGNSAETDRSRLLNPAYCRGRIVCIVRLLAVLPIDFTYHRPGSPEYEFGEFGSGRYAWHLELLYVPTGPIAAVGRRQLWDWEPPPEIQMMGLDYRQAAHDSPRGKSGRSAVGKR